MIKGRKTLIALIAFVFLIVLMPARSASAATTISFNPSFGQVGDTVTVTGTGLYLGQLPKFYLYLSDKEVILGSGDKFIEDELDYYECFSVYDFLPEDGEGTCSFSQEITIPAYIGSRPIESDGTYYFYLAKLMSMVNKYVILQSATFEITGFSKILLSVTQGQVGDEIEIKGDGYLPGEKLKIMFGGIDITASCIGAEPKVGNNGCFSVVVPVPEVCYGEKEVRCIGKNSGIEAAKAFTVKPKIVLSSINGGRDEQITIRGTGFLDGVGIYFGEHFICSTDVVSGSFTEMITVPEYASPRIYTIRAEDIASPEIINASADFEVVDMLVAPVPVEPADGEVDVAVTPVFSWSEVGVAESYEFQLGTNPGFNSDIIVDISIDEAVYSNAETVLDYDTYYYWRVRTVTEEEARSPWSVMQKIRTVAEQGNPGSPTTTPPPTVTVIVTSPPVTITKTQHPITVTRTNEVTFTKTSVVTTTAPIPTVVVTQNPVTITHVETLTPAPVTVIHTIEHSGDDDNNGPNWALIGMILGGAIMAAAGLVIIIDKTRY